MDLLDQYGNPISAVDAGASRSSGTRRPRLFNATTGLGTNKDKTVSTEFVAVRMSREQAERVYQMSWAAARLIDAVVDDMFAAGRRWVGDDEGANQAMEDAEADLKLWTVLPNALKAGRIFGTGMLIAYPTDGDTESELKPENVKEGGIANLISVDRWSLSVQNWRVDPTLPRYAEPFQYRWTGRIFGSPAPFDAPAGTTPNPATTAKHVLINSDRMFRFDGQRSPLTEGWTSGPWEREWGVSILTRALDDIMRDAEMAAAAGHLVNEASIWVQKVQRFRETLARGKIEKGDVSPEQLAEEVNMLRSIYRTLFIDAQDEAERLDVTWAGLVDVLNRQTYRLAAIGGIPITRFMGTSATGLSATGEGDARDWRITVEAARARDIDPMLRRRLDVMIARHAGLAEAPPYEWNALGDMTDSEAAELTFTRTEAVVLAYEKQLIDEDEARERLSQDEWWGELGEWTPPELDTIRGDEEAARQAQQAEQQAAQRERELKARQPAGGPPGGGGQ